LEDKAILNQIGYGFDIVGFVSTLIEARL